MIQLIRLYLKLISIISSDYAAKQAFKLFQRTTKKKISKREHLLYREFSSYQITSETENITVYEIGPTDGNLLFFVHGWNSNAGSMLQIAKRMAKEGHYCILFDLPAHGLSKLNHTNIKVCKHVLETVISRYRSEQAISIIAHSFGSAVAAYTLSKSNKKLNQLIYLSCPNSMHELFNVLKKQLNLSNQIYQKVIKKAETLLKEPLSEITVLKKTKQLDYQDLILLHDKFDKVLPFSNSELLVENLEKVTLISFEKIGHYRMLSNELLINLIAKKLRKEMPKTNRN